MDCKAKQVVLVLVCSQASNICRPMSRSSRVGRVFSLGLGKSDRGSEFGSEFGRGSEFGSISEPVPCGFELNQLYVSDVIMYPPSEFEADVPEFCQREPSIR